MEAKRTGASQLKGCNLWCTGAQRQTTSLPTSPPHQPWLWRQLHPSAGAVVSLSGTFLCHSLAVRFWVNHVVSLGIDFPVGQQTTGDMMWLWEMNERVVCARMAGGCGRWVVFMFWGMVSVLAKGPGQGVCSELRATGCCLLWFIFGAPPHTMCLPAVGLQGEEDDVFLPRASLHSHFPILPWRDFLPHTCHHRHQPRLWSGPSNLTISF